MDRLYAGWAVVDGNLVPVSTPYPPIRGGAEEDEDPTGLFDPPVEPDQDEEVPDDEEEGDGEEEEDPEPPAEKPAPPDENLKGEVARLRQKVAEAERRETARAERLRQALTGRKGGQEGAAPEENPYDLHSQTKQYLAWERKAAVREALAQSREERIRERQQDQQVSEQQATINSRWRDFKRAAPTVLKANAALASGSGWKPEVIAYLQPIVHRMTREGSGSGEDGAVTAEDIEHELSSPRSPFRALMKVSGRRRTETELVKGLKASAEAPAPRGTPSVDSLSKMSVDKIRAELIEIGDTHGSAAMMRHWDELTAKRPELIDLIDFDEVEV